MIFTDLMFSTVVTPFLADAAANAAPDGAWISKGAIAALCTGLGAIAGKLWPPRLDEATLPAERSGKGI